MSLGAMAPCLPFYASIMPSNSSSLRFFNPLLQFLRAIRYYTLYEGNRSDEPNAISQPTYEQWLNGYRTTADPGNSVLFRLLHMEFKLGRKFQELLSIWPRWFGTT